MLTLRKGKIGKKWGIRIKKYTRIGILVIFYLKPGYINVELILFEIVFQLSAG